MHCLIFLLPWSFDVGLWVVYFVFFQWELGYFSRELGHFLGELGDFDPGAWIFLSEGALPPPLTFLRLLLRYSFSGLYQASGDCRGHRTGGAFRRVFEDRHVSRTSVCTRNVVQDDSNRSSPLPSANRRILGRAFRIRPNEHRVELRGVHPTYVLRQLFGRSRNATSIGVAPVRQVAIRYANAPCFSSFTRGHTSNVSNFAQWECIRIFLFVTDSARDQQSC